jgi:hypothetical protein
MYGPPHSTRRYKVGVDNLKEAGKPVKDEDYVLGADDFFPIFLFVVAQVWKEGRDRGRGGGEGA